MNKPILFVLILAMLALWIIFYPKISYYFINNSFDPKNNSVCKAEERALQESFQGIVFEKFRDKYNHNYETIRVEFLDSIYDSKIFVLDNSGAFSYILKGDSIRKESGNLLLHVSRNGLKNSFTLSFDCKK